MSDVDKQLKKEVVFCDYNWDSDLDARRTRWRCPVCKIAVIVEGDFHPPIGRVCLATISYE